MGYDGFYGFIGDLDGSNARRATKEERERSDRAVDLLEGGPATEENTGAIDNYLLGDPAAGNAAADPYDIAAQQEALQRLGMLGAGVKSSEEQARREKFETQAMATAAGRRGAALQGAQERGGGQQASELSAIQGGQDQAWLEGDLQAGFGAADEQHRMAALNELGRMSGTARRQGFDEGMGRASAIDRFNQSNTDYRQSRQQRDTERDNSFQSAKADARMGRAVRQDNYATAAKQRGSDSASSLGTAAANASNDDGGRDSGGTYDTESGYY